MSADHCTVPLCTCLTLCGHPDSSQNISLDQYGFKFMCASLQAEKRAHHNALERKRRDHIKDSFTSLRESVPALQGEKVVRFTVIGHFRFNCQCFQRIC
jgi:hypothetical protein